jgi:hypothetical protein
MAKKTDDGNLDNVQPIEPYEDDKETESDRPPVADRRAKDRPGVPPAAAGLRESRRGRTDSVARLSRFEPKPFGKRFLLGLIGAGALVGAQMGLTWAAVSAELASRGMMGYVAGFGGAVLIAAVSALLAGAIVPRSYFKCLVIGAGIPAIAGAVLAMAPGLPVEPAAKPGAADAPIAPMRTALAVLSPRCLADLDSIETNRSKVATSGAAEKAARSAVAERDGKIAGLEGEKKALEKSAEDLGSKLAAEKTRADKAAEESQTARKEAERLNQIMETQKEEIAKAGEKIKAAEGDVVRLNADLAKLEQEKKKLEASSTGGGAEVEQLKLRLDLVNSKAAELEKKLAAAEAKAKAASRPDWLSDDEYRKLKDMSDARQQAKVKALLK